MSEYRDELKNVSKEAPYTIWTFFKWMVIVIIAMAVLGYLAQALGIINMNIKRETTQRSQQYVETKVNLLNKLSSDWSQLDAEIIELKAVEGNEEIVAAKLAQQKNVAKRIKTEAGMIPSSQVPQEIKGFISSH